MYENLYLLAALIAEGICVLGMAIVGGMIVAMMIYAEAILLIGLVIGVSRLLGYGGE